MKEQTIAWLREMVADIEADRLIVTEVQKDLRPSSVRVVFEALCVQRLGTREQS